MDNSQLIQEQLLDAVAQKQRLAITGGGSKAFYGREITGQMLSLANNTGITEYDPRELVISLRAGTTLHELKSVLDEKGQMLPFEPPAYGDSATIGGTIACGFSGPGRPYRGSARDLLLGTKILNGEGKKLTFGGQVMKNVAGYDLSRLMVGAMGSLGILLELSMKVLPKADRSQTVMLSLAEPEAILKMNQLAGKNLPLSAAAFVDGVLYLRFSSVENAVTEAIRSVGGEVLENDASFWHGLAEHQHAFFEDDACLWRLSLPPACPPLSLKGKTLYDWGGALRWFIPEDNDPESIQQVYEAVSLAGGHATQFKNGDRKGEVFQTLSPSILAIHQQLKKQLDPFGLLNPGRMYADF